MKDWVLKLIMLALIIVTVHPAVTYASVEKPTVYFNQEKLDIFAGVGSAGVAYVPFRPIFQKFDMNVSWDANSKSVIATNANTTIVRTNNSSNAIVNGQMVPLVALPFIDPTEHTFNVNLRFISETMKTSVQWVKTGEDASIFIVTES